MNTATATVRELLEERARITTENKTLRWRYTRKEQHIAKLQQEIKDEQQKFRQIDIDISKNQDAFEAIGKIIQQRQQEAAVQHKIQNKEE